MCVICDHPFLVGLFVCLSGPLMYIRGFVYESRVHLVSNQIYPSSSSLESTYGVFPFSCHLTLTPDSGFSERSVFLSGTRLYVVGSCHRDKDIDNSLCSKSEFSKVKGCFTKMYYSSRSELRE